ncbi:uroporphyrinogen-III C-methyltransferase [Skermanella rosea]|uniref:uroporphyrinogen-III C-methyltransferase n=1 Tax=Skermanella rosea TaxID=1817965 RepID=UPI001E3E9611|nr:uroporphyrinogen-III C-methyltransferase [Skermanella rosea]UEM06336.1 uroporphyrinogen-III C-methyltransferase [Skermanella rosea]
MPMPRVHLVGAGPGDPDLLTVKALRLIQAAEVVVYDRLVPRKILDMIPPSARRIFVGKAPRNHSLPQEDINLLLVDLARGGKRVVRLKGGDPFIFGRGSEEALTLAAHGVPFEVVPGVTAAAGCGAYAGIPLTHRGLATGVRFVTGHCRNDGEPDHDWRGMADPDTTLVFYMALANLGMIRRELVAAGLDPATPAAAVSGGTTDAQRSVVATLGTLPEILARQPPAPPCLIIIGRVVALAPELAWFGERELADA